LTKEQPLISVESIVAERYWFKFPALTLQESIQRVPGVAISREGGRGFANITLKRLGPVIYALNLNGIWKFPLVLMGTDSGGRRR